MEALGRHSRLLLPAIVKRMPIGRFAYSLNPLLLILFTIHFVQELQRLAQTVRQRAAAPPQAQAVHAGSSVFLPESLTITGTSTFC